MLLNPGRCHARCFIHALHKGKNGPQLVVGSWDKTTPTAFAVIALEWTQSVEAFPALFGDDVTRASSRGLATRAFARRNSYTDQTP